MGPPATPWRPTTRLPPGWRVGAGLLALCALASPDALGQSPATIANEDLVTDALGAIVWSEWEVGTEAEKMALLDRYGPCGPSPDDYHLVDFDGDGAFDLVYSGTMGGPFEVDGECLGRGEGTQTVLFENRGGTLTEVFRAWGVVVAMSRAAPWHAISRLVLRIDPCCAGIDTFFAFHALTEVSPLRFAVYDRLTTRTSDLWWAFDRRKVRVFDRPLRIAVAVDRADLRASPRVVLLDYEHGADRSTFIEGLQTYERGEGGVAIARHVRPPDVGWWFVIMDRAAPQPGWPGLGDDGRARWAGWISASEAEVADPVPKRVRGPGPGSSQTGVNHGTG